MRASGVKVLLPTFMGLTSRREGEREVGDWKFAWKITVAFNPLQKTLLLKMQFKLGRHACHAILWRKKQPTRMKQFPCTCYCTLTLQKCWIIRARLDFNKWFKSDDVILACNKTIKILGQLTSRDKAIKSYWICLDLLFTGNSEKVWNFTAAWFTSKRSKLEL